MRPAWCVVSRRGGGASGWQAKVAKSKSLPVAWPQECHGHATSLLPGLVLLHPTRCFRDPPREVWNHWPVQLCPSLGLWAASHLASHCGSWVFPRGPCMDSGFSYVCPALWGDMCRQGRDRWVCQEGTRGC